MKTIAIYWGALIIAYLLAKTVKNKEGMSLLTVRAMNILLYSLVFMLGLRMGANKAVIDSLPEIGMQSVIITLVTIAGSIMAVTFVRLILKLDRFGGTQGTVLCVSSNTENRPLCSAEAKQGSGIESIKNSITIALLVALGMTAGYFLICRKPGSQEEFLRISVPLTTMLLVALIFTVGFSFGLKGNAFSSLRKAGIGVIAFPAATILGTVTGALLYSLFSPMGIRETLVIAYGFGWFSYAPAVIAQAGYPVVSAMSFLHNALRETIGIITIPFVADKIGYIETTAVPGLGAWDVCLPIVKKYTNEDTVIYSFATGLMMFITIPVVIPLLLNS